MRWFIVDFVDSVGWAFVYFVFALILVRYTYVRTYGIRERCTVVCFICISMALIINVKRLIPIGIRIHRTIDIN